MFTGRIKLGLEYLCSRTLYCVSLLGLILFTTSFYKPNFVLHIAGSDGTSHAGIGPSDVYSIGHRYLGNSQQLHEKPGRVQERQEGI